MTPTLTVEPASGDTARKPGETIDLVARWSLSRPPRTIMARLSWFTSGKGTPDVGIVAEKPLGGSGLTGEGRFSFVLPAGPYSFVGQLITLGWTVEVTIDDELSAEWPFTLAPNGKQLLLGLAASAEEISEETARLRR